MRAWVRRCEGQHLSCPLSSASIRKTSRWKDIQDETWLPAPLLLTWLWPYFSAYTRILLFKYIKILFIQQSGQVMPHIYETGQHDVRQVGKYGHLRD